MARRRPREHKIKRKVAYEVIYKDSFLDPEQLAECRFIHKQIVLMLKRTRKQHVMDEIHEVIEAINYEWRLGMPHPMIEQLEVALYEYLRLNGHLRRRS